MERFPLRRAKWAAPFIAPFAPGRHEAVIDAGEVRVMAPRTAFASGTLAVKGGKARFPKRLVETAIAAGKELAKLNLEYYEDPVRGQEAMAEVRKATGLTPSAYQRSLG